MSNTLDATTTRFFLSAIDEGNYFFGADDEVSESFTAEQEFKRRRWAQILCTGAMNQTSLAMAQRVCKSWFPGCPCDCRREEQCSN